ncbi:6975_t:CDS:2 [Dentiscutata heterogama]|uniref:6975_t:CDS:1 n=1 Tax=Dentiscutata heterogama TaxID=1316150 RepID=A0ACA9K9V5_9GLOM|nr:6975_t:CDS:2 [Dentiscutata heterogama]
MQVSSINSDMALKSPIFNPIQNLQPFHKRYTMILHKYQLGIVTLLALFQLFFTDNQLQKMIENTNIYKIVKVEYIPGLNNTGYMVAYLLHENNIDTCGTVYTNLAEFSKELKVSKTLDWIF